MTLQYAGFKSLNDFYDEANWHDPSLASKATRASQRENDKKFTGTDTFEEAVELAKHGWKEGLEKFKQLSKPIVKTQYKDMKTHTVDFDFSGAYPDVQRFLAGEPECMVRFSSDNKKFRQLRIMMAFNQTQNISKEYVFKRGAAVLNLIDILEKNNIRCEVILSSYSTASDSFMINILAKRAEERLNLESLNFAMCHAAMYRRFGFSIKEKRPMEQRQRHGSLNGYGYGSSENLKYDFFGKFSHVYKEFSEKANIDTNFSKENCIILSATTPESLRKNIIEEIRRVLGGKSPIEGKAEKSDYRYEDLEGSIESMLKIILFAKMLDKLRF